MSEHSVTDFNSSDRDTSQPQRSQPMASSNGNGAPWTIREIEAAWMPPESGGKWWPLFREIMLRLEQTPERFALKIELHEGGATGAAKAITRYANDRLGDGALVTSYDISDGENALYVRRGDNYTK